MSVSDHVKMRVNERRADLERIVRKLEAIDWSVFGTTRFAESARLDSLIEAFVRPHALRFLSVAKYVLSRQDEHVGALYAAQQVAQRIDSQYISPLENYLSRGRHDEGESTAVVDRMQGDIDQVEKDVTLLECVIRRQTQEQEAKCIEQAQSLVAHAETASVELGNRLTEADSVLRATRDAAAKVGLVATSSSLGESRKSHAHRAKLWLGVSAGLAMVLVALVAVAILHGKGPPLRDQPWWIAANLGHFAARSFIVSVISYALVMAFRSYRAERHNEISLSQRINALAVYDAFKAAASEKVEDAVLLQATEAIFAPQPTGFADTEPGGGTHVTELLKVLKTGTS